jgi:hypothetical protein
MSLHHVVYTDKTQLTQFHVSSNPRAWLSLDHQEDGRMKWVSLTTGPAYYRSELSPRTTSLVRQLVLKDSQYGGAYPSRQRIVQNLFLTFSSCVLVGRETLVGVVSSCIECLPPLRDGSVRVSYAIIVVRNRQLCEPLSLMIGRRELSQMVSDEDMTTPH